jgi:phosphate transport system substrate-binding protein
MRRTLLLGLFCFVAILPATAQDITGSGSTFAYPVLARWAEAYEKLNGVHVTYQPIGSSAGVTEITTDVVDFGVTDAPLDDARPLRDGLAQFPVVIGAIIPVVNLDGITSGQLHLTGTLLADIYLGKVTKWSDPAIAALNPDLKMPSRAILVVYRAEGSGTTFNWSDYLAKVSDEWKIKVGVGSKLAWPTGVGGKGSGGVADNVARVKGAIGYVEYTYAVRSKLTYALVRNRAGNFLAPDTNGLQAATEAVDWAKEHDFYVLLSDSPAANAYPIMAMSFALVRGYPKGVDRSRRTLAFFRWAIDNGQELASSLGYLPLSPSLAGLVGTYWNEQIHGATPETRK